MTALTAETQAEGDHTPGPWEWRGNHLVALDARLTLLRDVIFWNIKPEDKVLIAAAPDLYKALEQLLDDMGDDGLSVCQAAKDMARTAIAKAEGSQ